MIIRKRLIDTYKISLTEDRTIILHCTTVEETKQKVYGYALRENGKVFIVLEDGLRVPVRAETIMPY